MVRAQNTRSGSVSVACAGGRSVCSGSVGGVIGEDSDKAAKYYYIYVERNAVLRNRAMLQKHPEVEKE